MIPELVEQNMRATEAVSAYFKEFNEKLDIFIDQFVEFQKRFEIFPAFCSAVNFERSQVVDQRGRSAIEG